MRVEIHDRDLIPGLAFGAEKFALKQRIKAKTPTSRKGWTDIHVGLFGIADGIPNTGRRLIKRGVRRLLKKR